MKSERQKKLAERLKKSSNKLTSKQKLWLKCYMDFDNRETFLNNTESARAAGYCCTNGESFASIGSQNFRKLKVFINNWLDDEGFDECSLKLLLCAGLQATETKFFAHEGRVIETRDVIAWEVRRRYLEMAMKVKGMFSPEQHEVKHSIDPWAEIVRTVTKPNSNELPNVRTNPK